MAGEFLTLDLSGLDEAIAGFNALQEQIKRARYQAAKKASSYAGGLIARGISKADAIPLKTLTKGGQSRRGQRVRVGKPFKSGGINVWVGYNPIRSAYLGRLTQQKAGARAGAHFFERAKIRTMKSGHKGAWYIGAGKFIEAEAEINSARLVVAEARIKVPVRMAQLMQQELNYQVNVKGR